MNKQELFEFYREALPAGLWDNPSESDIDAYISFCQAWFADNSPEQKEKKRLFEAYKNFIPAGHWDDPEESDMDDFIQYCRDYGIAAFERQLLKNTYPPTKRLSAASVDALDYFGEDGEIGTGGILVSSAGSIVTTRSQAIFPHLPQGLVNRHHPLNRGLVGWWYSSIENLDGGKWWYDLIANNHADLTNCTPWQRSPVRRGALSSQKFVNASAQSAVLQNSFTFSGEFTIAFWFRLPTSGISSNMAIGSGNISSSATNKIGFNAGAYAVRVLHGGSLVGNGTTPTDGNWHLYVVTRNSANKVDYFVDRAAGIRLFSDAAQSGDSVWSEFGRAQAAGSGLAPQYFEGHLDDIRFYNRALSASEIGELYTQSSSGHLETLNRRVYLPHSHLTETIGESGSGGILISTGGSTVNSGASETGSGGVVIGWGNCEDVDCLLRLFILPLEWGAWLPSDANYALQSAILGITGLNNSSADYGEYRCEITVDSSLIDSGQITIDIDLSDLTPEDYDPPFHCTVIYSGDNIDCSGETIWSKSFESDNIGGDPTPPTITFYCQCDESDDCGSIVSESLVGTGGVVIGQDDGGSIVSETISGTGGIVVGNGPSDVQETLVGTGGCLISSGPSDVSMGYSEIGTGGIVIGSYGYFESGTGGLVIGQDDGGSIVLMMRKIKTITYDATKVKTRKPNGFNYFDCTLTDVIEDATILVFDVDGKELPPVVIRDFDGTNLEGYITGTLSAETDTTFNLYVEE